MGCDIHFYVEKQIKDKWVRVYDSQGVTYSNEEETSEDRHSWELSRNYQLFGILAGVRNNYVPMIAKPRGIPADVSKSVKKSYITWGFDAHTPSYLTLDELLSFKDKTFTMQYFMGIANYKHYMKTGEIPYGSSYVQLRGTKLMSNAEMDRVLGLTAFLDENEYSTMIELQEKYVDVDPHFWNKVIPKMATLRKDPTKVRCVFWFDN